MTLGSISASKTLAAGQSSELGVYDVRRDMSLPRLGIGIMVYALQITGIRQLDSDLLMRVVM